MKTCEEINERIERKKAVVMTAEEIIGYVERKGLEAAAREVDVVTTATFGPLCSSGCFLNFGHAKPRGRSLRSHYRSAGFPSRVCYRVPFCLCAPCGEAASTL